MTDYWSPDIVLLHTEDEINAI